MITSLLKIPLLRLKYRFLPNQAQAFWAQELLEAQGLGAKLGQILAQGKKVQPPKSSLSSQQACAIFKNAFSQDMAFSNEVFAASMGQVFFTSLNGKDYAVKLLHPGIRERLKKEIDNIILLGGYFSKAKGFRFDKDVFRRFLEEVFEQETDLRREAHFQEKFKKIFQDDHRFLVPGVHRQFSNDSILTQELVTCTLAQDLYTIAHFHIFDFFFNSLLQHGILHGDLNDRNWGLKNDGTVVVYDYGCSHIISERRTNGFKKLLLNQDVVNGFKEFGVRLEATSFKGQEQELRDALFNPLLRSVVPASLTYSQELQGRYGDRIKELREFTDPWVLLVMRSLFSLIRIYQDRKIDIPLNHLIQPYLKVKEDSMKASQIKIEVMEGDKMVVAMTLPMTALENLESLMPPKVSGKVSEEGIKIPHIINQVKTSGYAPQELFSLIIENRSYRVWVE